MANLWVTELGDTGIPRSGGVGRDDLPIIGAPVAEQKVSYTTATQSSAFNDATIMIRFISDANCHVAFGSNPTATANSQRFVADIEYYRVVTAGEKLSVYDGSS